MPYITIESGVLTDAQKEQLIKRLTEVSSEIMNVPQEFFATTIKNYLIKILVLVVKRLIKLKLNICRHTNNPQFLELEKFKFVGL